MKYNYTGINLVSSSNTLNGNTIKLNTNGIYVAGSNNTITDNTLSNNNFDVFHSSGSGNTYSDNQVNYNTKSRMLTLTDGARTKNVGDTVNFSVSAFDLGGSDCNSCTTITTSPSETVTIDPELGNDITGRFVPTKSGIYSLNFNITDSKSNIAKKSILFFVGDTDSQTARYYLRGTNPTHGQPSHTDAKSMSLTAPTNSEEWTCTTWIQNSPDQTPDYPLANLSSIDINSWYKQSLEIGPYIGIERYVTKALAVYLKDSSITATSGLYVG